MVEFGVAWLGVVSLTNTRLRPSWLMKRILFLLVLATALRADWSPRQYRLEWDTQPGETYLLVHAATASRQIIYIYDKNATNGYTLASSLIADHQFTPWFSNPVATNILHVLQGSGDFQWTKYYLVAVTNGVMWRTSNIVGWPTNQEFELTSTDPSFTLRLVPMRVGPPMVEGLPPFEPTDLRLR